MQSGDTDDVFCAHLQWSYIFILRDSPSRAAGLTQGLSQAKHPSGHGELQDCHTSCHPDWPGHPQKQCLCEWLECHHLPMAVVDYRTESSQHPSGRGGLQDCHARWGGCPGCCPDWPGHPQKQCLCEWLECHHLPVAVVDYRTATLGESAVLTDQVTLRNSVCVSGLNVTTSQWPWWTTGLPC